MIDKKHLHFSSAPGAQAEASGSRGVWNQNPPPLHATPAGQWARAKSDHEQVVERAEAARNRLYVPGPRLRAHEPGYYLMRLRLQYSSKGARRLARIL